ncbi:MAG: hypothetical protein ABW004_10210 [Aeromicrobium sp.]|jgi:hypothetical protein
MTDLDTRTARRRKIIGAGLVAVLAAVLIAIVVVRSTGEKVLNENGETLVLVGTGDGDGDGVGLTGRLTDVGGCLGVDGTEGDGEALVVVWPHGTTIKTPDPLRVTVDGTVHELGDSVSLGGDTARFDELDHFKDKVPSDCRASTVFVAYAD